MPHLGKGAAHWKPGYSAHALASSWFAANGLPRSVRQLLDGSLAFAGAELLDAFFERSTDLGDGLRGPSQSDLLAVLGLGEALAVLAVEGKVRETFGPRVATWRSGSPTRSTRLVRLLDLLGVAPAAADALRYQLFHRSAAAIYEARRYRARRAMLLVHSFSAGQDGWPDFADFVAAVGLDSAPQPGRVLGPRRVGEVEFYAGWLTDRLPSDAG